MFASMSLAHKSTRAALPTTLLAQAEKLDDVDAQLRLGEMCEWGTGGVPKDAREINAEVVHESCKSG